MWEMVLWISSLGNRTCIRTDGGSVEFIRVKKWGPFSVRINQRRQRDAHKSERGAMYVPHLYKDSKCWRRFSWVFLPNLLTITIMEGNETGGSLEAGSLSVHSCRDAV